MQNHVSAHRLLLAALSLSLAGVLSGCGIGALDQSASGTLGITGHVHGGQAAVYGSTIQLYTVGSTGNGSASSPMLTATVQTDVNGFFNITGDYHCTNSTDQVYITSTGGNPGLPAGTNNPALVLLDTIGNCGNLSTISYITINEVTTAAAAWSLAPFISSFDHIGARATNSVGMANAMLGAQQLADPTTGMAATLASNLKVETGKLYALADALASCVNTDGGAGCSPLFIAATPSGGAAPSNTLNAAVNIVLHPGENVAGVFNAITATAPFPTTLAQPPSDWTMSLTVTGAGMSHPTALGVDPLGNVWVANYAGGLSGFTAQGTPLSATPFGLGTTSESYGLAIDPAGNIWVSNEEAPGHSPHKGSVTKFLGVASGTPGTIVQVNNSPYIYDSSITFPYGVAADTNGDIAAANNANSTVTVFNGSGTAIGQGLGGTSLAFPTVVVFDQSHGFWVGNYDGDTITHIAADGTILSNPDCCGGVEGLALDSFGNVWTANQEDSSVSEVANNGSVPLVSDTDGGVSSPSGICVDAAQNVWVSNFYTPTATQSFSELAGNSNTLPAGSGISPETGYGLDAGLDQPFSIVPDATGSLWISNSGSNDLVKFFGLAAPTKTPVSPTPTAP